MTTSPNSAALPAHEHLMSEREAAAFLGLSPRTLQAYRVDGGGPVYRRVGVRKLGYMRSDLLAYLNSRQWSSTSAEDRATLLGSIAKP